MLTIEKLGLMEDGLIFAKGIVNNPRLYEEPVKWIAKRGGGHNDWTIYYGYPQMNDAYIEKHGDKCFTKQVIRDLVPCDDEAYKTYRF